MPKSHRRVDRDQFWRETITAWRSSGQTVTAFCAARGLAEATFYVKRRALARPDPTVEVIVPGGVILRVPAGADPAAVARLVLALRGEPC